MTEEQLADCDELYTSIMKTISSLMTLDPDKGTPYGNLLEGLAQTAARYEKERGFCNELHS